MPGYSDPGFDTLALHAGAQPDPATGARAVPIHLTTSFVFESSDQAAALFNMERPGHVYSRDTLLDKVWDERSDSLDRTVDAHVKTLRAKLKQVAPQLEPIRTHRGSGYALAEDLPPNP